ncbi:MAG: cupin domain-containing protein [Proteobacteria bacterium]|nr:cupin domain-containing protein [Pseudomonadota bacterium]
MSDVVYPDMIEDLPDIDLDLEGVRGKLLQADAKQVVFFDIEPVGAIPPHAHSAQWGVVLEGEMELTVNGRTTTYRKGDAYFIPAGQEHAANFKTRFKAIDFFDEPTRYRPRACERPRASHQPL